jgi:hypothetical protein
VNEEKFSKSSIRNKSTAALKVFFTYFMSARKLNENRYQVQMEREIFNCKTPLIQVFFT